MKTKTKVDLEAAIKRRETLVKQSAVLARTYLKSGAYRDAALWCRAAEMHEMVAWELKEQR